MKHLISRLLGTYLNLTASVLPEIAARHAFHLFCYPFRAPLKSHHRSFVNGSRKFTFSHRGNRLQGYRWGSGDRKVLFLHGWQSHSFRWNKYIRKLSHEKYTVYAFDAPGHGFSGGRFLTVPLYSEVIESFIGAHGKMDVVIAHSIGSFSLLHALHHQPKLAVDKIVLMAPPGEASDFFSFFKRSLRLNKRLERLALAYFEKQVRKPITYYSTARFGDSLAKRGLIIHDQGDLETPYRYALDLHQKWKGSQLVTTTGLGHNLKSPEVISAVHRFIEEEGSPDTGYSDRTNKKEQFATRKA